MTRLMLAILMLAATAASAQTVLNPSQAEFSISTDHARVIRYELEVDDAVGASALTVDLGLPVDPGGGTVLVPVDLTPLPFGAYTAVVRAVALDAATGDEVASEDSDPSNTFAMVPGAPSGLLVLP